MLDRYTTGPCETLILAVVPTKDSIRSVGIRQGTGPVCRTSAWLRKSTASRGEPFDRLRTDFVEEAYLYLETVVPFGSAQSL